MKKKISRPQINIFNLTDKAILGKIDPVRLLQHILKKEHYENLEVLNIIVANAEYLRNLNRKFFYRNKTTNVISFNLDSTGEIYVSVDAVIVQSDLYYYLIHGLLHIIGYDHKDKKTEKLMDRRCRDYLKKFSLL
ncbi:MAG: rRNA maturation RNase YbeY [candidate division WOR-3 bacterium]